MFDQYGVVGLRLVAHAKETDQVNLYLIQKIKLFHSFIHEKFFVPFAKVNDSSSFWVTQYNLNYHVPIEQSGKATFGEGKATFGEEKATFETQKAIFQACISDLHVKQPTKDKMMKVYEKLGYSQPFGRAEIMNIISVSSYSAGELIKKMREAGLIEPVDGRGKGKYQFIIKPE